jgi:hypothetical protein
MWIIIIFVVIIFLGALLGGNSLGESIRMGCGFILFIIIGLYFYNKCSSGSINNEPHPSICLRCGGDGDLSEAELSNFLISNVLEDVNTIKIFQDWMDEHHPGWVNGTNLHTPHSGVRVRGDGENNGYGIFGPISRENYKKYKRDCFTYSATSPNRCELCEKN